MTRVPRTPRRDLRAHQARAAAARERTGRGAQEGRWLRLRL